MDDTYCIDASSFLKILDDYSGATRQQILDGFDVLIQVSRLRTVRVVLDEVSRHDQHLSQWLEGRKDQVLLPDNDELLVAAFRLVHQYPDLFNPRLNLVQADPFLVGAAQLYRLVVVSDELPSHLRRQRSRNEHHIPDVCAGLGLRCLNLAQMLAAEGIM